jgi:hypothetical protein
MSEDERTRASIPPQSVRLQEFFVRLGRWGPFTSFEEAYEHLVSTLEAVEDELTGIPNNPQNWKNDGRLYPPQRDNWFEVPGRSGITRMRTKAHNVFIASNGAIEIRTVKTGQVVFSKPGFNGRKVWDDE